MDINRSDPPLQSPNVHIRRPLPSISMQPPPPCHFQTVQELCPVAGWRCCRVRHALTLTNASVRSVQLAEPPNAGIDFPPLFPHSKRAPFAFIGLGRPWERLVDLTYASDDVGVVYEVICSNKRVTCTYTRGKIAIDTILPRVPRVQLIKGQGNERTRRIGPRGVTGNDFLHQVSLPARRRPAH